MKKIFYKLMVMVVAVTTCSAIFSSCTDDELPAATRLFRPVIASENVEAGLDVDTVPYIKLKWDKYADANQYVVKVIASDGTDSATITTDSVGCTFSSLKFDKEYNIKIHSLNTTTNLQSKDYVTNVTTPDFPTQLVNISATNIIDTQVRIIWSTTNNGISTVFDSIKVYNAANDSLEASVAVAADELISGQKIIRKLQPNTKYRAQAYEKGKYKGKKLFTTTSSESYDGLVFDLRGLTAADSYKYFSVASTTTLYVNKVDSIIKNNPDQNITFVLQGGVAYRMPSLIIPSTAGKIKFATGLSLNGQATFAVSGNFDAPASAIIGGFDFKNIVFTAAPLELSNGTYLTASASYGSTYLFNFGNAGANIKSISLTGCKIQYKRGVIREKAAAVVDTFSINNCILDSIGSYGVIKVDDIGAIYKNISIYNSTFSNCQYFISGKAGMTNSISSVNVVNSTFVYCIVNSKTLFDLTGAPSVGQFNLKNCLFGISGGSSTTPPTVDPITGATTGISGWSGSVNMPTADGCYFTSDFIWYLKAGATAPAAQIAGTSLTTNTAATFKSPTTKDFTIINSELIKKDVKPGDPRWY